MDVLIVNLGMGNLRSVERALVRAGAQPRISADASDIASAQALVLPGQGAFAGAAEALDSPLGRAVHHALGRGTPYLGICLGMQLLFEASEESPGHRGLGIIKGEVLRLRPSDPKLKVPHMGWNRVRSSTPLIEDQDWFYFVHSYHCVPAEEIATVATVMYGQKLCAAVEAGPVFACQFHPEKSQDAGEAFFKRFLRRAQAV